MRFTARPASVDDVAAALIEQLGPMDAMKLQKLLYYAQGWHLAITDRRLFPQAIEAWRDGPVVPSAFQQHRGRRQVAAWPSGNSARLDAEARKLIALVCVSYGHLSGDELSRLTHSEQPWTGAREGLGPDEPGSSPITDEALKSYFWGRELAGHSSADLAAGGLWRPPGEHDRRVDEAFAEVRHYFSGAPAEHPSDRFGNTGRSRSGPDPLVASRLRERHARRTAG